jgi:hypothetical protein
MSIKQLKREIVLLHKALIAPAEDSTLIMRIEGKEYIYKNIAEGNQALIDFGRNFDQEKNKNDTATIFCNSNRRVNS